MLETILFVYQIIIVFIRGANDVTHYASEIKHVVKSVFHVLIDDKGLKALF